MRPMNGINQLKRILHFLTLRMSIYIFNTFTDEWFKKIFTLKAS